MLIYNFGETSKIISPIIDSFSETVSLFGSIVDFFETVTLTVKSKISEFLPSETVAIMSDMVTRFEDKVRRVKSYITSKFSETVNVSSNLTHKFEEETASISSKISSEFSESIPIISGILKRVKKSKFFSETCQTKSHVLIPTQFEETFSNKFPVRCGTIVSFDETASILGYVYAFFKEEKKVKSKIRRWEEEAISELEENEDF